MPLVENELIWETDWDYDLNREIQYIDISFGRENYRVDRWVYRYGWEEASKGVYFQTLVGAIAYAEKKARDREDRYRVVKL